MKGVRTGGRQRGTPNKLTRQVREMIERALHRAGGVKYLTEMARAEPAAFLTLLGKCVPREIAAEVTHQYVIEVPAPAQSAQEWVSQHAPPNLTHEPPTTQ